MRSSTCTYRILRASSTDEIVTRRPRAGSSPGHPQGVVRSSTPRHHRSREHSSRSRSDDGLFHVSAGVEEPSDLHELPDADNLTADRHVVDRSRLHHPRMLADQVPPRMPVPYRDNPALTCGFAGVEFEVSRIPRPQKCPVRVPYSLHAKLSRNPSVLRHIGFETHLVKSRACLRLHVRGSPTGRRGSGHLRSRFGE